MEQQEREWRGLLAGLVPLMDARGYDAGDLRAILDG